MKRLRIILLVVLALLLPVRGAIGAAMLCPQGEHEAPTAQRAGHHAQAMHHGDHAHTDEAPQSDAHSVSCNVCAAFCSMTPMLSDLPTLQEQAPLASPVIFPILLVPAPTFQSDGPERPPRTL
ncbi:MAG: hypothetical protein ABI702_14970 [Burkholderiales bacterium]